MKEFFTRTISGLIYAVLMIAAITVHPLFFFIFFLMVLIIGMAEFYHLSAETAGKPFIIPGLFAGIVLYSISFFIRFSNLDKDWYLVLIGIFLVILALPTFIQKGNALVSAGLTMLGIIYISLPISFFNGLVYHPYKEGFDYQVLLLVFAIIWINDTGAYISGVLIGKHKLLPKISPKKTWEGFAGGLLLSLLATWLLGPLFPSIPLNHLWILSPVIVITGTAGDLAESAWKRSAGVKDSGKIMPGHGGMLDRFDSLIFAAPAAYLTISLLNAT